MDKYMTLDDVIKEFRTKITCDKDFDMFTEEEKKTYIDNRIKLIIRDLYDLRLKDINNLSERDTYVFRKLYGILDLGKCEKGVRLEEDLNIANVGGLKANFFKRVNRDIEKNLEKENFTKKKKYFMNAIGINESLFKLNLVIFNHGKEEMLNLNDYLIKTPFKTIKKELKNFKIHIRSLEDLKNININEREIQIIKLWFGLNAQTYSYSLAEIGMMFEISRTRVSMIVNKAIGKIRSYFDIVSKVDYVNSILYLNLSAKINQILNNAGIKTIKELLSIPDEYLMNLKGMGKVYFKQIRMALDNYENSFMNSNEEVKKNRIIELMKEINDLEEEKNKLEDRLSEIDRLTLQAKARLLNLKNEVSNGR